MQFNSIILQMMKLKPTEVKRLGYDQDQSSTENEGSRTQT